MQIFYINLQGNSIANQRKPANLAAMSRHSGDVMLQIFLGLVERIQALVPPPAEGVENDRIPPDPLSHPALRRMSPHELADIPFPRPRRKC
jgi:hypothetical protein